MNSYEQKASEAARDFIEDYLFDELIETIFDGNSPEDIDYQEQLTEFLDSTEFYDLREAADVLEELDEFEETDTGLWEGASGGVKGMFRAAAFWTYSNAVSHYVRKALEEFEQIDVDQIREDLEQEHGEDAELDEDVKVAIGEEMRSLL